MSNVAKNKQIATMFKYDQAERIFENVKLVVEENNSRSILDIGAGLLSTAFAISGLVERYLAVEIDAQRVKNLEDAGLGVVQGDFPNVETKDSFDCVLSSHSIPERSDDIQRDYSDFLHGAWELVADKGVFHIITFKGSKMENDLIREELCDEPFAVDPKFEIMMNIIKILTAHVKTSQFSSFLISDSAEKIAEESWRGVFKSVAEYKNHAEDFLDIIKKRYRDGEGLYKMPTQHLALTAFKVQN